MFESISKKDHSDLPILSATQENGIVFRNDLDIDIKFDTHALSNYKVVSPGDYIISLRSFQGGFELSEKLGIISPAYTVFAFNNQEKSRQKDTFWKYLFKRYDFIESLKRLTFGIRDGKAISFNQFSTLKLSFPNFDEQNKIATLLHELDRTITLHEEKKRQLECLKSALLQKMFADKSGYPAVRFKGFSEAWESRKLFDVIVKIIDFRGRTPKKMGLNWSERGHLALSALNVKDGYIDFSTDAHYANEILYKKWMSGNELLKGQVLFTTEAPMGNVAQVPDDGGYVLSQRTISFVSNNSKITDNFLAVVLRSSKVQRALSTLASGGTAKGVSQSTLSQLIMVIPISLDEQQKIERIIGIVEELTRLYQNKLEILTELKKSLLQNMFI